MIKKEIKIYEKKKHFILAIKLKSFKSQYIRIIKDNPQTAQNIYTHVRLRRIKTIYS